MELTRVDYIILSFLRKRNCISHFKSATLKEIMHIAGNSRPTNKTNNISKNDEFMQIWICRKGM